MTSIIPVRLPFKNCFVDTVVAKTEGHTIFFDTGTFSAVDRLERLCDGRVVILNTHGDWDHIGGNKYLQDRGAIVMVHKTDFPKEIDKPQQWVYGHTQFGDLFSVVEEDTRYFEVEGGQSLYPDVALFDGQVLKFDDCVVHVIHTPGHSGGCCSFLLPNENIFVTGDALQGTGFFGLMPVFSDSRAYMATMKKLMNLDVERTYIAHSYEVGELANVLIGSDALHRQAEICLEIAEIMEDSLRGFMDAHGDDKEITLKDAANAIADSLERPHGFGACLTALSYLKYMCAEYPAAARLVGQYILRD